MSAVKAWHFLREDGRLGYGDNREVKVGDVLSVDGKPELCEYGMHGSERLIDALDYAPGAVLCRVEISGDVEHGDDKLVGRHRKVMWMQDVSEQLHLFACDVAEKALQDRIDAGDKTDPRSHAAIQAKRDWVAGKITDEELDAAGGAARDAAWGAARDAAWYAACYAARDAARDAAWYAARGAARYAARGAARYAARGAQNEQLTAIMHELGAPE